MEVQQQAGRASAEQPARLRRVSCTFAAVSIPTTLMTSLYLAVVSSGNETVFTFEKLVNFKVCAL